MTTLRREFLEYFKALLEGRAEVSWNAWFKKHETQLSAELPRAEFLRLKFQKLEEAVRLLKAAGIVVRPSPLAVRERYYSLLHDSALDQNGRPTESFRRAAYDGAVGCLLDAQIEKGTEILARYLCKVMKLPSQQRAETLQDLCYDGEMELAYGTREVGIVMLKALAEIDASDDLLDPAVARARQLLLTSGT